jgi:electron transport complex protein RnfC
MAFHLFRSYEATHIPGHKEQTADAPYVTYAPEYVYIPAFDGRGNPLNNTLKVGDAVKKGSLLGTRAPDDFPIYSSVSGTIEAIEPILTAGGRTQKVFCIHNDKKDEWTLAKSLPSWEEATNELILAAMKSSGVIGMGGAGFPTYRKYNSGKPVDVLIINAIECEPFLTTDYVYGAEMAEYVWKALPYLLKVTGAKRVAFCTKKDKPALLEAYRVNHEKYPDIPVELYATADKYPMGYERNLVTLVTKKEYMNIPIEAQAIVDNIYTFILLGRYFTEGKTPDLRCITVAGEVKEPKNVLTPYGVAADDLIALAGGETIEKGKYINGGPLNGNCLASSHFATLMQSNGVLVMKANAFRAEPCWHCGDCCKQCPMDLQPVQIQMALKRNDLERMKALHAERCCGCGLCSYVCPARIDVSRNVQEAKAKVLMAMKEGK